MKQLTRRKILKTLGIGSLALATPAAWSGCLSGTAAKRHLVSLSFDDGIKASSIRTAEIYEKYGLSACINVIATGHTERFEAPNEYHAFENGDFVLWNELQARGHEIMMHGYRHANLSQLPLEEAQKLIALCIEFFSVSLANFKTQNAVFNFPYNDSTPELEEWLAPHVRAFRTRGNPINPLPHAGQKRLTCISFGPGNAEADIEAKIEELLQQESGWLIYNTHGLDNEGWGPVRAEWLDQLLGRLTAIESVEIVPVGRALAAVAH